MGKTSTVALIMAALLAARARAGGVAGTVTGGESSGAVVWVDGPREAAPAQRPVLSQKNVQFTPPLLVVVAGQTVDMPNDDTIAHNVFSRSPAKSFNLGIYAKGQSKAVTFEKTGVVELFCSIHRNMNAQVLVVPNAHFVLPAPDGSYRLPDLAPGTYTLKAWRPGAAEQSRQVVVPETGDARADFSFQELPQ